MTARLRYVSGSKIPPNTNEEPTERRCSVNYPVLCHFCIQGILNSTSRNSPHSQAHGPSVLSQLHITPPWGSRIRPTDRVSRHWVITRCYACTKYNIYFFCSLQQTRQLLSMGRFLLNKKNLVPQRVLSCWFSRGSTQWCHAVIPVCARVSLCDLYAAASLRLESLTHPANVPPWTRSSSQPEFTRMKAAHLSVSTDRQQQVKQWWLPWQNCSGIASLGHWMF